VLPPSLTSDPDRLARFAREAQVLAALNHPNIASIYHVEETSEGPALVMELVEGETLAERFGRSLASIVASEEQLAEIVVADFGRPEGGAGRELDRGQQDYV
jgi:serine/threonine-protein kinase